MIRIETERLILRNFTESDAEDIYEYLAEPEVNCFVCMKLADMDAARKGARERTEDEMYLAIEEKASGKVIGEIFYHLESADQEQDSENLDTASPCWMLNKAYQGKGYMYEAVSAFYDYLFNKIGVRRIYIFTEDYNVACQNLCKKLGMRHEGTFMEFVSFIDNSDGTPKYENTMQFAILKREWETI